LHYISKTVVLLNICENHDTFFFNEWEVQNNSIYFKYNINILNVE